MNELKDSLNQKQREIIDSTKN